ncbi:shikimate kinase [Paenibacillus doosanensis]|uniref:Shikimate kinase n=1 Tax=Paenibacillus konkukensis TaxID=2020716 RepID=A0ABY4RWW5_9BACL|nr:shikimate kinase [Paenibacillus konkukensis]MCS7459396.1 shikimate kinase [Paenibacillus doosanensis]UQZ87189.1 Shikimate kinase 2 [Paenibacillus konkukensis]
MEPSNIVLVGFMGTGKSTVGKTLASRLGWKFVDTDALIEERQGMSISDIFATAGEKAFRDIESETIAITLDGTRQVIATGGGAVLAEQNRKVMQARGWVVALTADAETIISRVSQDQNRPLVQGDVKERVHTLLETRKHAYDFAGKRIDTGSLSVEEIVAEIVAAMPN